MLTDTKYTYRNKLEVWGGIECTINRVQDNYQDQLEYAAHYSRQGDIGHFSNLGISKIRYPILWEHHEPIQYQEIDWTWTDKQFQSIRDNNMDPIAGLVHHGSGPAFTNLLDEQFAAGLANFAKNVATRYPWIEYYNPVNEPLTTSRFSGLYGHWYPHHQNETSFFRMLLNQLKGVILSMQAIRTINPKAKLVQTEDLTRTHSSPALAYQADFENQRKWLSFDFLCGKVDANHFFWNYLINLGIKQEDLQFFIDNPCPPDIMGFNYYVTSERYLDENLNNYPSSAHGGNGKHSYVDTEAVRAGKMCGVEPLLREAWERFQLPMAITECHLSCSREEQLRWFKGNWDSCMSLKKEGIDIRAVTAWSLIGAFDWNCLLTGANQYYESGVFDLQQDKLRPTALVKLIRSLSETEDYHHPLINGAGWWSQKKNIMQSPPLLIIGRNGTLGSAFMKVCETRSIPYIALSRNDLNISDEQSIEQAIAQYKPWGIINAAGYVRVDDAEINCNECFDLNTTGPSLIARSCRNHGIRFMTFSSDLVFDGSKNAPYFEGDPVNPLNVYGESKAEGERLVQQFNDESLIIRTSAFFGPWDKYNFVFDVLNSLKQNQTFSMPDDVIVSPTYVPDLAHTALDLFIDEEKGIWHLTNEGKITWSDFAGIVALRSGYKNNRFISQPLMEMGWKAQRPLYSVLESGKGIKMPRLENALDRYFENRMV